MTVELFLILLAVLATITSLLTEGVKKFLDAYEVKYAANLVVLIVAAIVGGAGTTLFYVLYNFPYTAQNVVCILLMIVANWLVAMFGYDKVVQVILQVKKLRAGE